MINGIEAQVTRHYARSDLEQAILAALRTSGKDVDKLTPADLSPVDEFHIGGRQATMAFAEQVDFAPGQHLLDVGCGIGGPSRFFAVERGCRVTGIDLSHDYVRTAEALSRRVGLDGRVSYRRASALALPFAAAAFDGAYMMHVGMNIRDKPAVFAEVRRVLKSAGTFGIFDFMRTGEGALSFPLHWADTPETSFVASPAEYREALQGAGFDLLKERDRSAFARDFLREVTRRAAAAGRPPPPLGIHILMKSSVPQKVANLIGNLEGGLIAPIEMIARARPL